MRKRLASLLVGLVLSIGLVVAVPSSQAQAVVSSEPSTGIHTLKFNCDDGNYHSTLSITYSITYVDTIYINPNLGGGINYHRYNWFLNSATYTGPTGMNPARGPQVIIGSSTSNDPGAPFLNATVGGQDNTGKYVFGAGNAQAPSTTLNAITGSNGSGPWQNVMISHKPSASSLTGRVYWYGRNVACGSTNASLKWNLNNPDQPEVGQHPAAMDCQNEYLGSLHIDQAGTVYDIGALGGENFSFRMRRIVLDKDADTTGIVISIHDSAGNIVDADPTPDLNIQPNTPPGTVYEHGVNGVNFPVVPFTYRQTGPAPKLVMTFIRGINGTPCTVSRDLSNNWLTEDEYTNTASVPFDDCVGSMTGQVVVTGTWRVNTGGDRVKLQELRIYNNSPATLRMPGGVGTPLQNPRYQEGEILPGSPFPEITDLTYMNLTATTAERNIAAGATLFLNISQATKWTAVVSDLESSAPSSIIINLPNEAYMSMDFTAHHPVSGDVCGVNPQLQDVVASSQL